jgi:hypothetical protein
MPFSINDDIQTIGLKFVKTERSDTPISHSLTEISVRTFSEQHLTPQICDHDSSINTDEEVDKRPSGLNLDKDVESDG